MISILKQLKASQNGEGKCPFIFTISNAESMFYMLDINKRGFITFQQYKHGLESLGINNYNTTPNGLEDDKITKETFLAEA